MSDTRTLLRENIRRLRARSGFTQAELAESCGLSPNYIAELEAGRRFPSAATLARSFISLASRGEDRQPRRSISLHHRAATVTVMVSA